MFARSSGRLRALRAALVVALATPGFAQDIQFDRDVRPILSDRCFQCHGVDANARKAGLRLDTLEGQRSPIEGRRPVVPGQPDRSELIARIEAHDEATVMPPPSSGKHLSDAERALLRRWIEDGAPFAAHWAFVPPRREAVPDAGAGWARSDIDRFVGARLAAAGLRPQPDADPETLIRRLYLDLTGLPPSLAAIDAFLADRRPDAYERLVDHLLASPHFGERMAVMWLDVARYADTNGFHHDNVRTAWPYRDWVIGAFNDNLPYDRFVIEQLAGDLLPSPTEAQRIATAFCRMHNINDEGGALDAEYRVEAVADRIETIGTAFMGLTMTCARCHDHKYDPLTQEDYYSMFAVFGSIDEQGVYSAQFEAARAYPPRLMFADEALKARIAAAERDLDELRQRLAALSPQVQAEREAWESALRAARGIDWVDHELVEVMAAGDTELERLDDGSVRVIGRPARETLTFVLRTDARGLRLLRLDALADARTGRLGVGDNGNAVVSAIRAEAVSVADPEQRVPVDFAFGWTDREQRNGDYDLLNALRGSGEGWALHGHGAKGGGTALLVAAAPFGFDGGTELRVTIACESRFAGHVLARPRVTIARAGDGLLDDLPLAVSDWWQAGPFAEADFDRAFDREHGPEAASHVDPHQRFGKVGWKHRGDVDDGEIVELQGERSAFYFAKELRAASPLRVDLSLGSDDGIKVFLDGREQLARAVRRGVAADQERLSLEIDAGEHLLVVKIVNDAGPAGFVGRLTVGERAPQPTTPWAWVGAERRSAAATEALTRAFGSRSPEFAALDAARRASEAALQSALDARVPVLVMEELDEPKQYHVLTRGSYETPDLNRAVTRRPPLALGGAFPPGEPADRLGFARWLVEPDHPLTARVHVNRIWQMLFGTGLVATPENFGQQADWPSHPALLDWLARELIDGGWDQKALIRRIVTSSVYRQCATPSADALDVDPANRLLSSFPRRRLAGEFVRDVALASSGLLVDRIGGPSVRPYQPEGLWREVSIGGSSNTQIFVRDDGDALFRRSLYTFWKRTSPSPQMAMFDAPTREFCVVRRSTTNTPLQALVLWNDEQFVEAARALAQRTLHAAGDTDARIRLLFRLGTGAAPDARQEAILRRTLAGFVERYRDAPADAEALVAVGETPPAHDLEPSELAAWTMLGSTVLNLDATIVRD